MSDEQMDLDVLIVGGGPAGLATGLRLMELIQEAGFKNEDGEEPMVALIEKGSSVGALGFSGGILNPKVFKELIPDWESRQAPLGQAVTKDQMVYYSVSKATTLPHLPGMPSNKGYNIVSLNRLCSFMADCSEERGLNIFPGFSGSEVVYNSEGMVEGVKTGAKGIAKDGNQKSNFEPGLFLKAKVTIFAEGPRGSLAKGLIKKLNLDENSTTQVYSTGVKELWKVPKGRLQAGKVQHTMGWPLAPGDFGGGFIYHNDEEHVTIGYVTSLDSSSARCDPHANLQQFKTHPTNKALLEGGEMLGYGAKVIPEGGYDAMPRLAFDGGLLVGDSAGLLHMPALKGMHYAMASGKLAAETIFDAMQRQDFSRQSLSDYEDKLRASWIGKELKASRGFRACFQGSMLSGIMKAGFEIVGRPILNRISQLFTGKDFFYTPKDLGDDGQHTKDWDKSEAPGMTYDGVLTFSKVDDVYKSGTTHEEDQPPHLLIGSHDVCVKECSEKYGNPCVHFCPAHVYEMEEAGQGLALKLNASNCVHCKTCDIKDPYGNITWVPPEGGGGPVYTNL